MKKVLIGLSLLSSLLFAENTLDGNELFPTFVSKNKLTGTIKVGKNTYKYQQQLTYYYNDERYSSCVEYFDLYTDTSITITCAIINDFTKKNN